MRKMFSLMVLCLLCVSFLFSCASGEVILSFEKSEINEYMYHYFASSYKGIYARTIESYSNTEAFWGREVAEGKTILDFLNEEVLSHVKKTLVCADLFDQYGLRFSDEDYEEIDSYLDELEYEYADGNANTFNQILSTYGVNRSILREIYIMETKVEKLSDYLFSSSGSLMITDAIKQQYLEEQYVHIRIILVNDVYSFVKTEDGLYQYDSEKGEYVTRELTEEEKAQKLAKIATVEKLLETESFEEVEKNYSEVEDYYGTDDPYSNGYYLTNSTDFIDEVVDLAFSLDNDSFGKVETEYGTFFVKRLAVEEKAYEKEEYSDFFSSFESDVQSVEYVRFLQQYLGKVIVNEDALAQFSLDKVEANYSF